MNPPAYKLSNVVKSYGQAPAVTHVLNGIDLEIPSGQYVALTGPSGSGKSTLLHLLGALDTPTRGSLQILGTDVSQYTDDALSRLRSDSIGFIFQAFHLLPQYDALANVQMASAYTQKAYSLEQSENLLRRLNMGHRLNARINNLSGGEKQRVAIARALFNNPSILLADEPTGALDQANGAAILEILDQLHAQGKTIIVVTHDPVVARRAERVVTMLDGRIHE